MVRDRKGVCRIFEELYMKKTVTVCLNCLGLSKLTYVSNTVCLMQSFLTQNIKSAKSEVN